MIGQRWIFLAFSSLSFFASEIIVEQTSVLVARLQGYANSCLDGTDSACKSFTSSQFNGLYVTHFWAGGTAALFSGFFIGRFGIWAISIVNATLLFCGTLFFTLGPYISSSDGAFGLMAMGRLIFSVGYFANIVLSHQVKAHWFYGKEMALSFTIFTCCARLGGVLAFATVGVLVETLGLQNALWVTFFLALLAPVSVIAAGFIYHKYASTAMDMSIHLHDIEISQFGFSKITRLGREFWTLALIIFFYFSVLFTLFADFPKFLTVREKYILWHNRFDDDDFQELHNYTEQQAGLITGIIADVALCAPLIGWMVDRWGYRDLFLVGSATLLLTSFLILSLATHLFVILIMLLVAISYAMMSASVWVSISVVTSSDIVGVGMGLGIGLQALGPGLWLLITGFMLDQTKLTLETRWTNFNIFMTVGAGCCFLFSIVSMYLDTTTSGQRRLRKKHVIPAMCAEMNEDIGECAPLIKSLEPFDGVVN